MKPFPHTHHIKKGEDEPMGEIELCDYCHEPIPLGEDIFLEGWDKSLACCTCCEKYGLLEKMDEGKRVAIMSPFFYCFQSSIF